MKAKEYYDRYHDALLGDDQQFNSAMGNMLMDMADEIRTLIEVRHITKDSSFAGVVSEINQKYNAVCTIFEKELGYSPIVRNGFLIFITRELLPGSRL